MARKKGKYKCRPGAPTLKDIEFIENHAHLPPDEIAKQINRTVRCVKKRLKLLYGPPEPKSEEEKTWTDKLHETRFWKEIYKGLLVNEVLFFEDAWSSYMEQFSSSTDILPTDELMIKDLVMLDLFVQRSVIERGKILQEISGIEQDLADERGKLRDDRDEDHIRNLNTQLNSLRQAKSATVKEHIEYQTQKDKKLRDLKGARDQRFKQLEESRSNIFELIKDLDTYKRRAEEGRILNKIQKAVDNTKKDWGEFHEFDDGVLDKILLSADNQGEE
jgi:hypothetical protein